MYSGSVNFSLPAIRPRGPLAFPVVRPDVLEAHGGGFPLVRGAQHDRRVGSILLELVEDVVELGHRLGWRRADLLKGVFVVHEAVDDRGHRHAEGRLAVVGRPRRLGDLGEIVEALDVVEAIELMLLVLLQRDVEGTASDQVARGAAVELGVQRRVVVRRLCRRELDLDVGIVLVEGGDDGVVPDVGVVVAPTLDLQRAGLRRDQPGQQRGQSEAAAHSCDNRFHPILLIRRA